MRQTRRHRQSLPRHTASRLEVAIFTVGLVLAAVSGVVAFRMVGLYGGILASGYRGHIRDDETGRMLLVHEARGSDGAIIRRVIDGRTVKEVDLDVGPDGIARTRAHVSGTDVTILERDRDGDGRTDAWEYYDTQKRLVKVGFSLAGDGVVNAWAYRDKDGQVATIEVSTRRDGKIDRWEHYEKGQLARVEEDANHDGRVDHWSTYDGGILLNTSTTPPGR